MEKTPVPAPATSLPRMLTLDQVAEVLNVGKPVIYTLVTTGELRAAQFGGRGYLAQSRESMPFLPGVYGQRA
ncbi:helix-turn-helix domain-containing protein [Pseudarthrobacter sp. NPDC089323]